MTRRAELRVLGDLALYHDGEARALGGPKAQQLLSVMAAHRGSPVSADRLIETMWGDAAPVSAKATVQSQVSRLRSILAPECSITLDASGYRLEIDDDSIDSGTFEALLSQSRVLADSESVSVLESALALWHGPAFGRHSDLAEVHGEALRLDELRLVATDEWAEKMMATGGAASMVGELEALISRHPLREHYWRLLVLALYRTGRQAEALRRVDELRKMLGREMGLDPSQSVRDLEAQVLADDPGLLVDTKATGAHRGAELTACHLLGATSFVGRDPDLRAACRALRSQPLVTVTGPGGVGKTRLAMRVAAAFIDELDDGVAVVELAALRDPSGTAQVIARALDVQQRQHRTIESTIEEHLAPKSLLLLLDNCEHVTDAVAPLVDRLRSSCPRLRILTTSRGPLGLPGEYVTVLAPLAVPTSDVVIPDEIALSPAVQLFLARAAAAAPGFALAADNVAAVASICRRLDGLPLALELAASRLRTMGVEALASRLDQRIELLGQTQRGADRRQRTLHALVEWSHALLSREEREVFEQLAVFAGGFDLSAVEAVCRIGASDTSVIDHLAGLVDKSMVVLVDDRLPRYRVLEPLREFGLDRLRERGVLDSVEDRHLDWFLDLAQRGASGMDTAEEPTWSSRFVRDFDNFRAAHLTALRREDAPSALRLVASLREFAFRRVQYEVMSWADASTALANASGHSDLPTVLAVSAYGRFVRGDMEVAISLARQALDLEGGGDLSSSGLPERVLGNALFYMEQVDDGLAWMDRMLGSATRSGSDSRLAHARYMRSVAQTSVGDPIRGAVLAGEARVAAEAAGSPTAHAQADYALGLALEGSDPDEALVHLERASVMGAEAGDRWIEAFSLTEVYWLRARRGEHLAALAGYADVIDIWHRGGDWANQWLSLRRVLGILINLGVFDAAAVLHGALAAVGASHALPFEPDDAQRLSDNVGQVRSLLGPERFADAVRRGAAMKDTEIVGFVRQQIAELTRP